MSFWMWWLLFSVIVVAASIFKMWIKVKYPAAKQNKGYNQKRNAPVMNESSIQGNNTLIGIGTTDCSGGSSD
ncbi:hypothetical protein [Aliiroseovarius sp. 2305UL8-7]|uniref:hypothetical protein n=1 Tax=Aliiroseovarius conchicola TaxID=3121637 RepID=UPI0035295E49